MVLSSKVEKAVEEIAMRKWVVHLIIAINGCVSAMEMEVSSGVTSSTTAMFVLGDSSVDCGSNTPFNTLLHINLSQFPCNGSDTTLLPQLLAMKMGLPYTIPFYSQNGSVHAILGGVNFGSAEATIMYPGSRSYQSLNQQLRQAFETIQLLQLQLGQDTANNFIKSSIFYLSFGKDDFIHHFVNNPSALSPNQNDQNFTQILVGQMTNAVRSLYASNVRKIVCAGVLPLGCAPHLLASGATNGCSDEVNMLVVEFNTRLEENLVAINAELHDSHIIFCDVYRAMMEFINNPKPYGIEDVQNACCGVGNYGGTSGCFSTEMACSEASTHVWWDLYNPTPAVNSMIADSAWSAHPLSTISRPVTLQKLLSSLL